MPYFPLLVIDVVISTIMAYYAWLNQETAYYFFDGEAACKLFIDQSRCEPLDFARGERAADT